VNPVYLDTVGLIALWDEDDEWHDAASRAFEQVKAARAPVVTTSYILAECGNAAARTAFRLEVDTLRSRLEVGGGLIFPTVDDWRSAWDGYRQSQAGAAGLVDHLSFVVMRRLDLQEAFTNDRHFRAAGFHTLF
jgi:uncharacterized protein